MAAPRNAAPTPNIAPFIAVAAVIVGIAATLLRLPGGIGAWALLIVAAWMSTPPQLTGKKDAAGYPTVGNPGEGKKMRQHQRWAALRWKLILSPDWLFNDTRQLEQAMQKAGDSLLAKLQAGATWLLVPRTLVTWAALGAGAVTFTLPVDQLALIGAAPESAGWLMWPNAIAAYIIVRQLDASNRQYAAPSDPQPAIDVTATMRAAQEKGMPALAVPVAGLIAAVAGFAVTTVALNGFDLAWLIFPWPVAAAGVGVLASSLVLRQIALPHALDRWRKKVAAREMWDGRWVTLKVDPAPYLTEHDEHTIDGQLPVLVDTFDAPPTLGAEGVITLLPKMTPAIGGGYHVMGLNEPDLDSQGQPVPGSKSPIKVTIVAWPTDSTFNALNPDLDQAVFEVLLRAAASRNITTEAHLPQLMLLGVEKISVDVDGKPAAWKTTWAGDGAAFGFAAGQLGSLLDAEVIPDAKDSAIYIGALTSGEAEFADQSIPVKLEQLGRESAWGSRWYNVLKQGEQAPFIQHAVYGERRLATGETIFTQPFMTPQGYLSERYMEEAKEKALSSTLNNAPFVSVQRWDGTGARSGERHHGAFRVVWSHEPVSPSPAKVVPTPGRGREGTMWVLAAAVIAGFDAAKLPRPEVVTATPLTGRASEQHIWDIQLRLYGAVTLGIVKQQIEKIRNGMGAVEWIRVTASEDGCRIVAGAKPANVTFARREHKDFCTALDWEQAFTDAKVITQSGQVPTIVSTDALPKNPKVQRLIFRMPPGLDRSAVRNAKRTLMPATGNIYLEDEAGPTPDTVALIACPEQPVPFPAPFDWEEVDTSHAIPFASGVTGEPIIYDWKLDPHLLVLGGSGSGKSALLQNIITGALIRGCEVYIADPTKAAADFQYAKPWAKAIAVTDGEASALMDHVYAEVSRRKLLNAKYGAATYADLPGDVRPPHIVVIIDEFTSLMFTERVEKLPANATEEETIMHAEQELSNSNRRNIGGKAGRIVREARSAGVTLVLAAQELKADTLARIPGGTSLKGNTSSILLGKASFGSRMSALKDAAAAPELGDEVPQGRGLFESSASSAQVIQSWFDAPDHLGSMVQHITAVRPIITEGERIDLTVMIRSVDEAPIFGRRIDAGDLAEDDDEVVDVAWDGGEVDLGVVDIDFSGLFDDDGTDEPDEVEHAPASVEHNTETERPAPLPTTEDIDDDSFVTPSPVTAPSTVVLTGPGCPDDAAPENSIDVDLLPAAEAPITGHPLVDSILAWLIAHPGAEDVEWVSPAAFDTDEHGAPLYDVLEQAAVLFGVSQVIPSYPAAGDLDPEIAADEAEGAPLPVALPERDADVFPDALPAPAPPPEPVAEPATPAEPVAAPAPARKPAKPAPAPVAAAPPVIDVPPPPPIADDAGIDDMFGAPRRVLSADERF